MQEYVEFELEFDLNVTSQDDLEDEMWIHVMKERIKKKFNRLILIKPIHPTCFSLWIAFNIYTSIIIVILE